MAKKKFTPILGDLKDLTEQQKQEYVLGACEFLGVPPELGLVSLILMDVGDGARQLQLYVKRGATDIIRANRKINIDSMEEAHGQGYVAWKVKGHDESGRQEIAIGAVSTIGLSGQKVADALMTAQSKAQRRLTLIFAGGGFLDETEVRESTTNLASAVTPLSVLAQPTVAPNTAPGKDITDASKAEQLVPKQPEPLNGAVGAVIHPSAAQVAEEPKKKRRKTVSLDSTPSVVQPAAVVLPATVPVTEQKPDDVKAAAPSAPQTLVSVTSEGSIPPPCPVMPEGTAITGQIASEKPSDGGTIPTEEQKAEFRKKLSEYVNVVLPQAGFLQSEKLGSRNDKMKLFVQAMFPKANTKNLSVQQWTHFFNFLDGKMKEIGAAELVKFINKQIGEASA